MVWTDHQIHQWAEQNWPRPFGIPNNSFRIVVAKAPDLISIAQVLTDSTDIKKLDEAIGKRYSVWLTYSDPKIPMAFIIAYTTK